jgi:fatty acid desaturase
VGAGRREAKEKKEVIMLWTILVILFALWLIGLLTAHTFGGLVHILLVIAVIVLVVRLLKGKRIL